MIYLFVCEENVDRSKTAARIFRELIKGKGLDIEVESAGMRIPRSGAGRQITKEIADKADKIFVMQNYMIEELQEGYSQKKEKIIFLDVRDGYDTSYPQEKEELEKIFNEKLRYFIKEKDQANAENRVP